MCGVVGAAGPSNRIRTDRLLEARSALAHRGPDDRGLWATGEAPWSVVLASTRLSIRDLSPAGHLPMASDDQKVIVAYNGELYNHAQLRQGLERAGHRYRSRSDTETIVHAYEEHGLGCFAELDGMFAVALYDARRAQVVLARDRMGIKPLYYWWDGAACFFASELKALLVAAPIPRVVDRVALDLYLALGYVPAPHCLIAGVRKLRAGSYVVVDPDGLGQPTVYWRPSVGRGTADQRPRSDLVAATRRAVEGAVRSQLVADVPVGVTLSGGLDSTIVAAIAREHHGKPIDTYSVGFGGDAGVSGPDAMYNRDRDFARDVAAGLGARHHEVTLTPSRAIELLPGLVAQLDEPTWEGSFVSISEISRLARANGTVVLLSGDGADEVFGGYPWHAAALRQEAYERIPFLRAALPLLSQIGGNRPLGIKARDLSRRLGRSVDEKYRLTYEQFDREERRRLVGTTRDGVDSLSDLLAPILACAAGTELADAFGLADLRLWVGDHFNQRIDRMSMAASVEARVPFQANAVVELGLAIPMRRKVAGCGKALLRAAFRDLVPPAVLARPKRPFAIPEIDWLRSPAWRPTIAQLIDGHAGSSGLLDPAAIGQLTRAGVPTTTWESGRLLSLLHLELWARHYLKAANSPIAATPGNLPDYRGGSLAAHREGA